MRWKELFFFNHKDKIAIIALSCLCLMLYGSYLAYPHVMSNNVLDKDLEKFADFQKDLKPIYHSNNSPKQANAATSKTSKKLGEGQQIDLNSANENAFKKVPGIGDTFAKRIVEYRTRLGGFTNIEQLMEVKGISEKKFDKIHSYFCLAKQPSKRSLTKLIESEHPYFSGNQIATIKTYTGDEKNISSIEALQSLEHFTPRDIDRIKEYIHFK